MPRIERRKEEEFVIRENVEKMGLAVARDVQAKMEL